MTEKKRFLFVLSGYALTEAQARYLANTVQGRAVTEGGIEVTLEDVLYSPDGDLSYAKDLANSPFIETDAYDDDTGDLSEGGVDSISAALSVPIDALDARTTSHTVHVGDMSITETVTDFFRRDLTYDDAPKGSKNEDWVPGETFEKIQAGIANVWGYLKARDSGST
jgi:hypothetical protein